MMMSDRNYYWLKPCKFSCENKKPEWGWAKWFIFTEEQMRDMGIEDFHVVADPNGISKDLVVVSDGS